MNSAQKVVPSSPIEVRATKKLNFVDQGNEETLAH
jgi:hypothetical protein